MDLKNHILIGKNVYIIIILNNNNNNLYFLYNSKIITKLFLKWYNVLCFCFWKILLMGHKGFVDRDLWSFLSAFSKSSQISILIEVYCLLKHLSLEEMLYCGKVRICGTIYVLYRP